MVLTFFFFCDGHTKQKGLSVVSEFVVGLWDGLDKCEISLPEILSQSCPVLHDVCFIMIHSLANNIKCKLFCINMSI